MSKQDIDDGLSRGGHLPLVEILSNMNVDTPRVRAPRAREHHSHQKITRARQR
jgi:hypothetical protein